ncbi:MAG: tetratricopeptide repeat protein [Tepidisphaeraceae bacterium]
MQVDSCDALMDSGLKRLHGGDPASAEAMFRQALEVRPDNSEALGLLGVCLFKQDRKADACEVLTQAVSLDPGDADAHYNLAEVLAAMDQTEAAQKSYFRCIEVDSSHPTALRRLAELRARKKDYAGAVDAAQQALGQTPEDAELMFWTAQQMILAGQIKDASALLRRATSLAPENLRGQVFQFNTAISNNDIDGATETIERACKLAPDNQQVLLARFLLYYRIRWLKEAADAGSEYVKRFPDDADAHYTLACAFQEQKELGGAALGFARYIELRPERAVGYARLGHVLLHVGHLKDAETQLKKALELDPKLIPAHMHLSYVLDRIPTRQAEAVAAVRAALEIDPRDTEALNWLAMLLTKQGKHTEAAQTYRQALQIDPKSIGALLGYGNLLAGQGRIETAWENFEKAWDLAPDKAYVRASGLFFANAHPDVSQDQLFVLHQQWASLCHREVPKTFDNWDNDRSPDRVLRIGYLSPDLRGHSVAYFLQPILSAHDTSAVEVVVYDCTPVSDQISVHLHALASRWYRIVGGSVERVSEMIREHQIDILVDLAGHTAESRLDVFACHPAPVQVSYIGYPNTTGLPEIEYRFTDALADPVGADTYYTERLVRLDGGFLCFNPPPPSPDVAPLPAGESGAVSFASFNAVHKINRKVVALWSSVLRALPGSRLMLKAGGLADPETRAALLENFANQGIDESQIVFVERTVGYREHLLTYNQCDIALDTFPYNGTTTTCEALWMGVPVIALAGDRHSARVSMSILSRLDLNELIAQSPEEFIAIATRLAGDRAHLAHLRSTLRTRMSQSRLMDAKAHARAVEAAYRDIWREWCAKHPL